LDLNRDSLAPRDLTFTAIAFHKKNKCFRALWLFSIIKKKKERKKEVLAYLDSEHVFLDSL
jgi:lipoprotein NlpI